jgi:hypothetical protein
MRTSQRRQARLLLCLKQPKKGKSVNRGNKTQSHIAGCLNAKVCLFQSGLWSGI